MVQDRPNVGEGEWQMRVPGSGLLLCAAPGGAGPLCRAPCSCVARSVLCGRARACDDMKGARAQLEGMATSYDPNFEFNAPKVPLSPRVLALLWSWCLRRSFTIPVFGHSATGRGLLSAAPRTVAGCDEYWIRPRLPWHTRSQAPWREAACLRLHA